MDRADVLKPLPGLPNRVRKNNSRPPSSRRFNVRNFGPRFLQLDKRARLEGGPGEPPPGFLSFTTSKDEWYVYWGMAKVFNDPPYPRKPPYTGGVRWRYQKAIDGGRRVSGGAVVDFVVGDDLTGERLYRERIGIRVQTERFHVYALQRIKAYDLNQAFQLSKQMRVIDLYSQDFIKDPTGNAIVRLLHDTLAGTSSRNPATSATATRAKFNQYL